MLEACHEQNKRSRQFLSIVRNERSLSFFKIDDGMLCSLDQFSRGPLSNDVDVAPEILDKHGSQLRLITTMPCALRALQTKILSVPLWSFLKYHISLRSCLLP